MHVLADDVSHSMQLSNTEFDIHKLQPCSMYMVAHKQTTTLTNNPHYLVTYCKTVGSYFEDYNE